MIIQGESGLATGDYNTLLAPGAAGAYQVIASRYNLKFSVTDTADQNDDPTVDVLVVGDMGVRARTGNGTLVVELFAQMGSASASGWSDPMTVDTSVSAIAPSLVHEGNTLRCFYYKGGSVYYRDSSDEGLSWGAAQEAAVFEDVIQLSATYLNKCHIVSWLDSYNAQLHYLEWDGSWEQTSSEIYWPHYPTGFHAIALDEQTDVLAMTANMPPIIGTRVEGGQLERISYQTGGAFVFLQQNGRWSEHFDVDIYENQFAQRLRKYPRLSWCNDRLVLTCYGIDGNERYYHACHHYYTSKDGKYWTIDQLANIGSTGAAKMVAVGDYAYLISAKYTARSYQTGYLGYIPEAIKVDITEYISDYGSNFGRMRQSNVRLEDLLADGSRFTDSGILGQPGVFMLQHYWGTEDAKVLVSTEEVDSIEPDNDLPTRRTRIMARDRLMWMTDRIKAPHILELESQMVGFDDFPDYENTGYGGLRHTAVKTGSWVTEDDTLKLKSNNQEGQAWSAFKLEIWNGSMQCGFQLGSDDPTEYAGVLFRVLDKDNYWAARYEQDQDKIALIEVRGGETPTQHAVSSTLSWQAYNNWYYIKVVTFYSLIRVYSSTNGTAWTLQIEHIADGAQHAGGFDLTVPFEQGAFGYTGLGFSDEDEWTWPGYIPPNPPPTSTGGSGTPVPTQSLPTKLIALMDNGHIARATGLAHGVTPVWEDVTGAMTGTCTLDDPSILGTFAHDKFSPEKYHISNSDGLWEVPDMWVASPAPALVNGDDAWKNLVRLDGYIGRAGYLCGCKLGGQFVYSFDNGATYGTFSFFDAAVAHFNLVNPNYTVVGVRVRDFTIIQAGMSDPNQIGIYLPVHVQLGLAQPNQHQLWRSTDGGASWSFVKVIKITAAAHWHTVGVPVFLADGSPNTDGKVLWVSCAALGTNHYSINGYTTFTERPFDVPDPYHNVRSFGNAHKHTGYTQDPRQMAVLGYNDFDSRNRVVMVTEDDGLSWRAVRSLSVPNRIHFINGYPYHRNWLIWGGENRLLEVSDDYGATRVDFWADLHTVTGSDHCFLAAADISDLGWLFE